MSWLWWAIFWVGRGIWGSLWRKDNRYVDVYVYIYVYMTMNILNQGLDIYVWLNTTYVHEFLLMNCILSGLGDMGLLWRKGRRYLIYTNTYMYIYILQTKWEYFLWVSIHIYLHIILSIYIHMYKCIYIYIGT
jgi:hypothetical protein